MITIREASRALQSLYKVRRELVPCLLGEPGIGKTQSVYELRDWVRKNTEFKDCKVVEMIASTILPSEVSGITMPDKDNRSLDIYDHRKLSSLKDGDILFFDELLQGSDQTLKACLTLVMERRMMSGKMLPDIMIVAASNPKSYKSLEPSIRQRFLWIDVMYSEYEYETFLKEHDIPNPDKLSDIVDFSNNNWNMITPRTAFKLAKWLKEDPDADIWIESVFGAVVSTKVKDAITYSSSDVTYNEMMDEVMGSVGNLVDALTFESLRSCGSIAEAMEILNGLPNWDEIQKALMNMTFDEKTGEFKESEDFKF